MRLTLGLLAALAVAGCSPSLGQAPAAPAALEDRLLEDVAILSADDMEGRMVGSAGGARARAYLLTRLTQTGLSPALGDTFEHAFPVRRGSANLTGVNLLAMARGREAAGPALLVMAHYDHVGVRNGEIYNGADDNASGVAALLAIAASLRLSPPRHDVIFALVDAEEGGLSGSRAVVADPAFRPLLERTALAVNFDMLSRSATNELYAAGGFSQPWLRSYLDRLAAAAPVSLRQGHDDPALGKDDWTGQSDHKAFEEVGKAWVYFGVEDHPDYHRPTDDASAIPEDFFRRSARTVEAAVRLFDSELAAIAALAGPWRPPVRPAPAAAGPGPG